MNSNNIVKVDPRIKRTRKMFVQALISLIIEGYDVSKLTVQIIADRAELNRATFYLHYDNIDGLMEQMMDEVLDEMFQTITVDAVKNAPSSSSPFPALTSFLDHFYQNAGLYTVMLENKAFYCRVFSILMDIISMWGEERKSQNRPFLVLDEVIASSTLGIVGWWLKEKTPYSPNDMARQISILVNGTTDK